MPDLPDLRMARITALAPCRECPLHLGPTVQRAINGRLRLFTFCRRLDCDNMEGVHKPVPVTDRQPDWLVLPE